MLFKMNLLMFIASCSAMMLQSFGQKKAWTFEFKSVTATYADENKLTVDLNVERVSRDVFALSGELALKADIDANSMVEAKFYRSATGSSDYKLTPYAMPKKHVNDFLNGIYKDMLMNSLKECSNAPQFESAFVPPLEKKTYTLDKCEISNEGMPEYFQEGYYKLEIIGSGVIECEIEIIIKVDKSVS